MKLLAYFCCGNIVRTGLVVRAVHGLDGGIGGLDWQVRSVECRDKRAWKGN